MPQAWNSDPPGSLPLIVANIASLVGQFKAEAVNRSLPTIAMAQNWHRTIYKGVSIPVPYYAGEVRDTDQRFPDLIGYEVIVGVNGGVPSVDVPSTLLWFEGRLQAVCGVLDAAIPAGGRPSSEDELRTVVEVTALAHGHWVRIHPFANGNGRTARLWANWVAVRYGLPPFVQVKPRPAGQAYARAAEASMRDDHRLCAIVFHQMLDSQLGLP